MLLASALVTLLAGQVASASAQAAGSPPPSLWTVVTTSHAAVSGTVRLTFTTTSDDAAVAVSTYRRAHGHQHPSFDDLSLYEFGRRGPVRSAPLNAALSCPSPVCSAVAGSGRLTLVASVQPGRELLVGSDNARLVVALLPPRWSLRRSRGVMLRWSSADQSPLDVQVSASARLQEATLPSLRLTSPGPALAMTVLPCDEAGSGQAHLEGPGVQEDLSCAGNVMDTVMSTRAGRWHLSGAAEGVTGFETRFLLLSPAQLALR